MSRHNKDDELNRDMKNTIQGAIPKFPLDARRVVTQSSYAPLCDGPEEEMRTEEVPTARSSLSSGSDRAGSQHAGSAVASTNISPDTEKALVTSKAKDNSFKKKAVGAFKAVKETIWKTPKQALGDDKSENKSEHKSEHFKFIREIRKSFRQGSGSGTRSEATNESLTRSTSDVVRPESHVVVNPGYREVTLPAPSRSDYRFSAYRESSSGPTIRKSDPENVWSYVQIGSIDPLDPIADDPNQILMDVEIGRGAIPKRSSRSSTNLSDGTDVPPPRPPKSKSLDTLLCPDQSDVSPAVSRESIDPTSKASRS